MKTCDESFIIRVLIINVTVVKRCGETRSDERKGKSCREREDGKREKRNLSPTSSTS
jgi:hypothetical protein